MKNLGLRALASNTAANLIRQIAVGLVQLTILAIIGRIYGPQGSGFYTVSLLLPSLLANLLNLGLAPANVYYLASRQVSPVVVWRVSFIMTLGLGLFGLASGGVLIVCFGDDWFPAIPERLLWLALASFPLALATSAASSIFQGLQQFRAFNIVLVAQPLLSLLGVLGITLLGYRGIEGLLIVYNLAYLASLMFAIVALRPYMPRGEYEVRKGYAKLAFRYGYKAHLSNILAFLNYKIDIFLVNFYLGATSAGLYVLAVQLSERLWMLSQAVSTTLLPRLSELSNDEEKRLALTPIITRGVLWVSAAAGLALSLIASPMIVLIFGPAFAASFPPLLLLLPGIVLGSASRVLANDIAARGRPEFNMYTSIIVVCVNIVGNVLLIPAYGIIGASLATTVAYTLNFALRLVIHQWFTRTPWCRNIIPTRQDIDLIAYVVRRGYRRR